MAPRCRVGIACSGEPWPLVSGRPVCADLAAIAGSIRDRPPRRRPIGGRRQMMAGNRGQWRTDRRTKMLEHADCRHAARASRRCAADATARSARDWRRHRRAAARTDPSARRIPDPRAPTRASDPAANAIPSANRPGIRYIRSPRNRHGPAFPARAFRPSARGLSGNA